MTETADRKFQVVVIYLYDGTRATYAGQVQLNLDTVVDMVKDVKVFEPEELPEGAKWEPV